MKPTIKDIAEIANVSPATVSNALNNKKGVSADVKQLVFRIARELGYVKDNYINKKAIRFIIFKKHGYVVSDTPFFSSLIEGIQKECKAQGYELLISHINIKEEGYEEFKNMLNTDSATGLLVLATEMVEENLDLFCESPIPLVLLDNYFRNGCFDSVLINNVDAAFNATSILIENGHDKIGYLRSSIGINNFSYREQGYLCALNEYGLELDERTQIYLEPTMEGAYRDMKSAMENDDIRIPTALFADNDIIALGAMRALKEAGIKIPDDVSIIGFDDMPFCEITTPRLTTIKVFKEEMGSVAVKRLIHKIDHHDKITQKIEINTELVMRESIKKLQKND
ncbi:MAG: LacI family transcriptional regulator [Clostridiales bacterium]|nr:LacI family transcriptional regulator [Clostridiales bacterium]